MASIVTEVFYGKAVTYTAFSFFTLYLYDYALTLNDEMELFWTHGGSWVLQTAFITSRYLPAAGLLAGVLALNPSGLTLDDISCRGLMAGNIICQSTMSVCSTGLICLRILTIFQHNPRIKITLHISFWLGAISIFYFTGHALYYLLPKVVFAFDTCAIIVPPPPFTNIIIALAYMSGLPCEAVIIGATWYHAYATKDLRLSAWDSISWPILSRMYKDGMMFFVISLALRSTGCLNHLLVAENIKRVVDFVVLGLTTVVATRFFFSLRRSIVKSIEGNGVVADGFGGTIQVQTNHEISLSRMRRRTTNWTMDTRDFPSTTR
ncbi:SubName: Full=Uncharacterized protein {ECO:0000313/EMBL:CCA71693.1} [Serendipita indica DSM 11827]|uniref:DUF6533 domain-containing protein n=1 Tax=Serendipita indica (strain DSM 11827) TaxID=1109443 RepID=G4TK50_SERID|nr:SubName: Full=Uncharacterized protein {ECO:0000313/EMBL:CCA71693.1} [Serendipita indica DSM 11827]CCA71693.1 hypothetical protein PIIN_05628 [Serendipita indica DSM 11827]